MPLLKLEMSVSLAKEKKSSLLSLLSRAVSAHIGKPEQYVMVVVEDNGSIMMSGIEQSSAFVALKSIGGLGESVNKKLSLVICNIFQKECGIPPNAVCRHQSRGLGL